MSKLTISLAEKLQRIFNGEQLSKSSFKGEIAEELISENIVVISGRGKQVLTLNNSVALTNYLFRKFGINDLLQYINTLKQSENLSRADLVKASSNSKTEQVRTFTGFLVNTIQPIAAKINGRDFTIDPIGGTFVFISDYEHFTIEEDVIIVGIENAENFRLIDRQKHLFDFAKCLFVSRYPQNQSKDFINWMLKIRNPYYHFGDYDFAGLNIFVNEYQKHLPDRAHLFVPKNLEHYFELHGNRELFYNQKINFDLNGQDDTVKNIYNLINKYQKGLEQEALIM